jgi:hypothetical protein
MASGMGLSVEKFSSVGILTSQFDKMIPQLCGSVGFKAWNRNALAVRSGSVQNQRRQTKHALKWPAFEINVLQTIERQQARHLKPDAAARFQHTIIQAI